LADPSIRDFIGPSENAWDFNAPDAMGGFGPLEMTDELRRQILQMVGRGLDAPDATDPAEQTASQVPVAQPGDQPTKVPANELPPSQGEQKPAQVSQPLIEPASDTDSQEDENRPVLKRSHGSALPT
jgi:hypothetical protein